MVGPPRCKQLLAAPILLGMTTLLAIAAAGCSSGGEAESPPDSPPPTIAQTQAEVLAAAAVAMGTVDTVSFAIERSGAPVYIDSLDIIAFNRAEGRFAAPTSADALVTVEAAGFNTEIGAIAFEGTTWLSDPISGKFTVAPGSYAFDPVSLFDPTIGWRPLLENGLTEIEWRGLDEATGRYRFSGVADPDRLEVITAGLVRDQEVVLDLALDSRTGTVMEVTFSTVYEGATSDWLLTFSGYGEPVDVNPPPTSTGG